KDDDHSLPIHRRSSSGYRLSTPKETDSENEEDHRQSSSEKKSSTVISSRHSPPTVNFGLHTPTSTHDTNASSYSHESPLKFFDPAHTSSQQKGISSTGNQNVPVTS